MLLGLGPLYVEVAVHRAGLLARLALEIVDHPVTTFLTGDDFDRFELLCHANLPLPFRCRANLPVISLAAGNEPTTPEITVSIGVNFSSRLHNPHPE